MTPHQSARVNLEFTCIHPVHSVRSLAPASDLGNTPRLPGDSHSLVWAVACSIQCIITYISITTHYVITTLVYFVSLAQACWRLPLLSEGLIRIKTGLLT